MSILTLVSSLRQKKVKIWAENGTLRYTAPKGVMTPELLADIKVRKQAILEFLRDAGRGAAAQPSVIPRLKRNGPLPLSIAQERIWFLYQLEGKGPAYNIPKALRLRGPLIATVVEQSLNEILRRHEVLRAVYEITDGTTLQTIQPDASLRLAITDLGHLGPDERENEARHVAAKESLLPFDLGQAPALRSHLIRLAADDHVLVLVMHHIASDGRSIEIFNEEFAELYQAYRGGLPSPLPELPIQYSDYAAHQKNTAWDEALQPQIQYWKQRLLNAPAVLALPTDRTRSARPQFKGNVELFEIGKPLTAALRKLSREFSSSLFMTVLSAFAALLHRYSGQEDICIGCPTEGRKEKQLQVLIGMFVNTLVMRIDLSRDPTFIDLVQRVKQVCLDAFSHPDAPIEKIMEAVRPDRNLSASPLFQVTLSWLDGRKGMLELPGLRAEPFRCDHTSVKFDMELEVYEREESLVMAWFYNTDLFEHETARRMIAHFQNFLGSVAAEPSSRLSQLNLMGATERRQILTEWNQTAQSCDHGKSVIDLFEERVLAMPQAIALIDGDRTMTYAELDRRGNNLAHALQNRDEAGPEVRIGVLLKRSDWLVVAILGILKAGAAYVPIDPAYPPERIRYILHDSGCSVVLTDTALAKDFFSGRSLDIRECASDCLVPPVRKIVPGNLAYVIYTSGSTGLPKGCQIEHRNLSHYLQWAGSTYFKGKQGGDFGLFTSIAFDLTVTSLFLPLIRGKRLHVYSENLDLSEVLMEMFALDSEVDCVKLTPSHISALKELGLASTSVRLAIVGGEALSKAQVEILRGLNPQMEIYNEYGPTETTVGCVVKKIEPGDPKVLIGRPIANTEIYILDRQFEPVPIGVIGEVYIGGRGVGRGYLQRPDLTAQRFIPDLFQPGGRWYRTGDAARWLADGNIDYLGRLDNQIKIRGFRIEPGEIEAALLEHPGISEAVVSVCEGPLSDKFLAAYVVRAPSTLKDPFDESAIRKFLQQRVPDHMVPARFVELSEVPLTSNGKLDRAALPKVEWSQRPNDAKYAPPTTDLERIVIDSWEHVLHRKQIGIEDNYFDLGGDSIRAIQVVSRLRQAGWHSQVWEIFQYPTICEFAQRIRRTEAAERLAPAVGSVPLTPIQQWFFAESIEERHHFNQSVLLRGRKNIDADALKRVMAKIQDHHDALRLTFDAVGGKVVQRQQGPEMALSFAMIEALDWDSRRLIDHAEEVQRSFNLETGPLFKSVLYRTRNGDRLLLAAHHLVIDGVSWRILLEDLEAGYLDACRGRDIDCENRTTSFKEWAETLAASAATAELESEVDFWLSMMVSTPESRQSAQIIFGECRSVEFVLPAQQTEALLTRIHHAYETEIDQILLTALARAFNRWTGQTHVHLLLEGHGRESVAEDFDLGRTVGWFTSLYPAMLNVTGGDIALEIGEIKKKLRQVPRKGIGFGLLYYLGRTEIQEQLRTRAWPQISFNYLGQFSSARTSDSFEFAEESVGQIISPQWKRNTVLDIVGISLEGKLHFKILFHPAVHSPVSVEKLGSLYKEELEILTTHCLAKSNGNKTWNELPITDRQKQLETSERRPGISRRTSALAFALITPEDRAKIPPGIVDAYPLTALQAGMLFHSELSPESAVYHELFSYHLKCLLDLRAIREALDWILARHAVLRTSFTLTGFSEPLQMVHANCSVPLEIFDLTALSKPNQDATIHEWLQSEKARPINWRRAPVWRAALHQRTTEEFNFSLSLHHAILDGWSAAALQSEIFTRYFFCLERREESTVPLTIEFRDYVALERAALQSSEIRKFWQENLKDAPRTRLALWPQSNGARPATSVRTWEISPQLRAGLSGLAGKLSVPLKSVLLAAHLRVMGVLCGESEALTGLVSNGRPEEEDGDRALGLFLNTVPIRVKLEGGSWQALVRAAYRAEQAMLPHRRFPLAEMQQTLGGTPLFDTAFNFIHYHIQKDLLENPAFKVLNASAFEQTNFTLVTHFRIDAITKDLTLILNSDPKLVGDAQLEAIGGYYLAALNAIAFGAEKPYEHTRLIPPQEWNEIMPAVDPVAPSIPGRCIHEVFEGWADAMPEAPAVTFEGRSVSYEELNARANGLAYRLMELGVGPEVLVGLYAERSWRLLVAILGILKAGGAYVPLDPSYPKDRLEFMIEDSGLQIIVTDPEHALMWDSIGVTSVCTDVEPGEGVRAENPLSRAGWNHAAYIIYTSGSTGRPKGVIVEHGNLARLFTETDALFGFRQNDVWTLFHSISFDFSVWEIWGALAYGGRLVVIPYWLSRTPDAFHALLKAEGVTVLNQTPSAFRQLVQADLSQSKSTWPLRVIIFGGEALEPRTLLPWFERYGDESPKLVNMYGITETTVHVTFRLLTKSDLEQSRSLIGQPIPDLQLFILDRFLEPVPVGVPGEIYVCGAGVARGYLHRTELTCERFILHSFSSGPARRLYRTGDLARHLPGREIEYLGRIDNQVKIRGFRIELGEIEAALHTFPGVSEAAVLYNHDGGESGQLAAYLAPVGIDVRALRDSISERLPEYMIPSAFVLLDRLPLTTNGKLNRGALPKADASVLQEAYIAPRTPIQQVLAQIWRNVLRLDSIGVDDDFFRLGGHSLLATQLISRVREVFSIEMPLRRLFESPTLAALAAAVENSLRGDVVRPVRIPRRRGAETPGVLSFAQERLWFLDQLEPGNPFYNVAAALRLTGQLNVSALERALSAVIARHEALRTVFPAVDGKPAPRVTPAHAISIGITDVGAGGALEEFVIDEARTPFDLSAGPLWRARLLRVSERDHALLFTMHHIVSDGWSLGVLIQELGPLYTAFSEGRTANLAPLPLQYSDFAAWHREWMSGALFEAQMAYWKTVLKNTPPVLELPSDRPRPATQSFRGSSVKFIVPSDVTLALRKLSERGDATLFMTLLAGVGALLSRYCRQDDIVIGAPIANRTYSEIEGLVGFFVNTLALRMDLRGDLTFEELLHSVRKRALDAYAHQDLPFEKLVDELGAERDLSLNPLFQVMFALQNTPLKSLELPELHLTLIETKRFAALFDLVLDMWETGDELTGVLEFNTDLFDESTIQRWVTHFQFLLADVASNPKLRLSELPRLSSEETYQLLEEWRGPRRDYPIQKTLHALFTEQALATPDRIAIVHGNQRVTFAELNLRATHLAHRLRKLGVKQNAFVAILNERGVDFLAAMLGIMKAGCAFLPIDPDYPEDRIRHMLEASEVRVVLSREGLIQRFATAAGSIHWVAFQPGLEFANPGELEDIGTGKDLAYLLYTSGSTGLPKGAMIRHEGAINHIFAEFELLKFHPGTAFLQSAPSSSDISVWQLLGPSLIGARTVVADFEIVCDPPRLFDLIKTEGITLIELVPGVMNALLEYAASLPEKERALPDLAWAMITGEAAPVAIVNQWLAMYPGATLVNAYGPTEASDDVCQSVIENCIAPERRHVPIGRPLPNLTLYVLDQNLKLLPCGVPGEICVSGVGVGVGYWKNEEKTKASFIANPYASGGRGETLYRTGDIGRWLPDGSLECWDRLDHQIKLRGFRVELGEIESVIGRHPAVREAAVSLRPNAGGEDVLVAYVVPARSAEAFQGQMEDLKKEQVQLWQSLHENSYRDSLEYGDITFNVIGWDSTYTGLPLSPEEMREYVNHTVARARSLRPRRVLEIGCGTGLILFRLIPSCEHYTGTDLSQVAIDQLRALQNSEGVRRQVPNLDKLVLEQRAADSFDGMSPGQYDLALLPSVVQYFPDIDYLQKVLEGLLNVVEPGGHIFLGDIRSLPLLEAFHGSVQLFQAPASLTLGDLNTRIEQQLGREQELAIDPEFFLTLPQRCPRIAQLRVLPKRGRHQNEMTRFRYDVILSLKPSAALDANITWNDWDEVNWSLERIQETLRHNTPATFGLRRIRNVRVAEACAVLTMARSGKSSTTAGEARAILASALPAGLEPEDLWELGEQLSYDVDIRLVESDGGAPFDAAFIRRTPGVEPQAAIFAHTPVARPLQEYANNPLQEKLSQRLIPELRRFLKEQIPNYMVPSDYVIMQRLPLTPAGKIDRAGLPVPPRVAKQDAVAPRTDAERAIALIWNEVLGTSSIGVNHDFFELGGHSLKATQVVSRIQREFSVEATVRDIFQHRTVAELAARVESLKPAAIPNIPKAPEAPLYALSHAQRRLWVLTQIDAEATAYHMPGALLLEGRIDREAFASALQQLVQRHEMLRTAFVVEGGVPYQKVLPTSPVDLGWIDLIGTEDPDGQARLLALQDNCLRFEIERGKTFRITLIRLAADRHVLLCNMHHIISDEWSSVVMVREFVLLYQAIKGGGVKRLAPLRLQYRDYSAWQNDLLASGGLHSHRDYWRQKLSGALPILNLQTDFRRPSVKTWAGATRSFQISAGDAQKLQFLAKKEGVSSFILMAALVKVLLYRYTNQEDIIVGFPIAGRDHADLEDQIGFYVNTLPLRSQVDPGSPFSAFLAQVKRTATEAYDHQRYPFDLLVDELKLDRDVSRSPMFDVVIVMQNAGSSEFTLPDVRITPLVKEYGVSKFDLSFNFEERSKGMDASIVFNTDLFLPQRMEALGDQFIELIQSVLQNPSEAVGRLNLLSPSERSVPDALQFTEPQLFPSVVDWFRHQSVSSPTAIALVGQNGELDISLPDQFINLTYRELDQLSDQIASHLSHLGVVPGAFVGLGMKRSPQAIIALIGILKAGGAYVPLDPEYPVERLCFMVKDSGVEIVLTNAEAFLESSVLPKTVRFVSVDSVLRAPAPVLARRVPITREMPAYVIYTSGSTGKPKGCVVTHGNLIRLFTATERWFNFGSADVWTCFHSLSFDFSVWEIWGALLYGGRLIIVPYWMSRSPEHFAKLLLSERVTVLNQTPSAFRQLIQMEQLGNQNFASSLRYVIFGGEELELRSLLPWINLHGAEQPSLINMYGITETTVHVTYRPIRRIDIEKNRGSMIGQPIPDLQILLLDHFGQLVPTGVPGEIVVGGAGVAQGYLNQPELTAAKFIGDPLDREPSGRWYRSGDLAVRHFDGDIEYLGRIDQQIKIRGFRIELGEIEAVLQIHPTVLEAVVVAEGSDEHRRLVAYYRSKDGREIDARTFRALLAKELPSYMHPAVFMRQESFPLTANGKLDRHALPRPEAQRSEASSDYIAPKAPLERTLAGIFCEVLQLEKVGVNENFFEIGANSLLLIQAHHKLATVLKREVSIVSLFRYPTIGSLARSLQESNEGGGATGIVDDAEARSLNQKRGRQRRQKRLSE